MIHAKEDNCKKGSKRKRHFKEDEDKIRNKNIWNDKNEEGNITKDVISNSLNKFIYEGSVKIKNKKNHIFYNKAQVFNRDMSIVLIKALEIFMKEKNKNNEKIIFRGFNIIELLSASGMRSIRYAKELEDTINHITTNDIDKYACKQIKRNFIRNNINKEKYTILCNDANSVMNILNVDNMYTKKRNNKKLDIGFTYINNINNCIDYFKEAFKFLNFLTHYNRRKNNTLENSIENDTDSTTFLSNDDDIITTKVDNSDKEETYIFEQTYDKSDINCNDKHNINIQEENKCLDDIKKKYLIKKSKLIERYMFDIIDIDPYGSSIEYLESCLKYGRSNFFILITNTDMRILNGKFPDVSFYKYNSMIFSNKVNYNNEFSIRVLFYKIKMIASKYKKCIIPFISINIDFYIRLLVHVIDDALQTKDVCIDTGIVYQCNNCSSFHINPMAYKKDVNHLSSITENIHSKKRRKMKKNKIVLVRNVVDKGNEQMVVYHDESKEQNGDIKNDANNDDNNNNNDDNNNNNNDDDNNNNNYDNNNNNNDDDNNNSNDDNNNNNNDDVYNNNNDGGNNHNNIHKSDGQNHNEAGADANQNCKNTFTSYKYKSTKLNISNKCEECGGDILIGGPIYIGKLHNEDFIHTCISLLENLEQYNLNTIKTRERILINFRCLKQEINIPLYYNLPSLFRNFKICSFSRKLLVNALLNLNYEVSYFHKDPDSVKTNAPNHVFMDIFRAIIFKINSKKKNSNLVQNNKTDQNNDNSSAQIKKIYSIDTIKDEKLREKLLSYQFFKKNTSFENINISNFKKETNTHKLFTLENPEPFWGPMRKHFEKN
ncbi:N2,N2-dimethylguanosine tRNA methyltransferase, putative [Plasmodium sp. DRC-Itaito]|nr:N2,N2-dimethylguanosine tRNA methyltransferase, putative [Plasmodium sp. DRC-Itaito]